MTRRKRILPFLLLFVLPACGPGDGGSGEGTRISVDTVYAGTGDAPPFVRVATFTIPELSAEKVDSAGHPQLVAAAGIVQRVRPDILLVNDVDLARAGYGLDRTDLGRVARRFHDRFLAAGPDSIRYRHLFVAPSNTGILSGVDLNRDGVVASPADVGTRVHGEDSYGYGEHPGQHAMALFSRFPVDTAAARTFQGFLWADLPGNHLPEDFYGPVAPRLRLSSKSHWDVPVEVDGRRLHVLASHPTPPGSDGPENRNGRRNFDEIAFWVHYLEDDRALYDDQGRRGGLPDDARFVIVGDLNADPSGSEAALGDTAAVVPLLRHPDVFDPPVLRDVPTAGFRGGLRIDYVLPSDRMEVLDGGVFWPDPAVDSAGRALAEGASDHRLVWLELRLPPGR